MLCKEIFKVQCVPAAAAAHTSVNLRARQLCWACSKNRKMENRKSKSELSIIELRENEKLKIEIEIENQN